MCWEPPDAGLDIRVKGGNGGSSLRDRKDLVLIQRLGYFQLSVEASMNEDIRSDGVQEEVYSNKFRQRASHSPTYAGSRTYPDTATGYLHRN